MEKISAGIVSYNPDIVRLKENIAGIVDQVDCLFVIDNHSDNLDEIRAVIDHEKISLVCNEKNYGIAYALNQIIGCSKAAGCSWNVFLDQDSVAPYNMISEYRKYIHLENVGMLCPVICERNIKENKRVFTVDFEETQRCITSGSMLGIGAYDEIGPFNNKMFIDQVDFEYTARIAQTSIRIYRINTVLLSHQLGDSQEVVLRGKKVVTTNHSPIRRYYASRNRIYCLKKYPRYINYKKVIRYFIDVPVLIIKYEDKKLLKICAILKGLVAGIFMR